MKRFYKEVTVLEGGSGYGIALDGRAVKTPAGRPLGLPSRALAEAIAQEWRDQGDTVIPHTMPLTRLATTATDITSARRSDVVAETLGYAETDLLCYRADYPPELAARQQAVWQPLVDWATLRFDAPLAVTAGIVPTHQSRDTIRAFAAAVEALDAITLTALHAATQSCGSLVLGLALVEGRLEAASAFAASQLDETFQIEQWGEDSEQTERRRAIREDIEATERLLRLLAEG
jgi:chaperone required for assembly of F1-ATPase